MDSKPARAVRVQRLVSLHDEWMRRAKVKFEDAEKEQSEIGRRVLNHGAFCYFNAASELGMALAEDEHGLIACNSAQSKTSEAMMVAIRAHCQANEKGQ